MKFVALSLLLTSLNALASQVVSEKFSCTKIEKKRYSMRTGMDYFPYEGAFTVEVPKTIEGDLIASSEATLFSGKKVLATLAFRPESANSENWKNSYLLGYSFASPYIMGSAKFYQFNKTATLIYHNIDNNIEHYSCSQI